MCAHCPGFSGLLPNLEHTGKSLASSEQLGPGLLLWDPLYSLIASIALLVISENCDTVHRRSLD